MDRSVPDEQDQAARLAILLEIIRQQTEALAAGGVRAIAERRTQEIEALAAHGHLAQAAAAARQLQRATAIHAEQVVAASVAAAEDARQASVFGRDHLILSQQAQQLLHAS